VSATAQLAFASGADGRESADAAVLAWAWSLAFRFFVLLSAGVSLGFAPAGAACSPACLLVAFDPAPGAVAGELPAPAGFCAVAPDRPAGPLMDARAALEANPEGDCGAAGMVVLASGVSSPPPLGAAAAALPASVSGFGVGAAALAIAEEKSAPSGGAFAAKAGDDTAPGRFVDAALCADVAAIIPEIMAPFLR
jgi:hypothetical protein